MHLCVLHTLKSFETECEIKHSNNHRALKGYLNLPTIKNIGNELIVLCPEFKFLKPNANLFNPYAFCTHKIINQDHF